MVYVVHAFLGIMNVHIAGSNTDILFYTNGHFLINGLF